MLLPLLLPLCAHYYDNVVLNPIDWRQTFNLWAFKSHFMSIIIHESITAVTVCDEITHRKALSLFFFTFVLFEWRESDSLWVNWVFLMALDIDMRENHDFELDGWVFEVNLKMKEFIWG